MDKEVSVEGREAFVLRRERKIGASAERRTDGGVGGIFVENLRYGLPRGTGKVVAREVLRQFRAIAM